MIVLLLKLILIRRLLDFVEIKKANFKFSKSMGVLLKIAHVIDGTDEKKGGESYLFSRENKD